MVLEKDDVLTEAIHKPGFASQVEGGLTVVLDCNLTEALVAEGIQREGGKQAASHAQGSGF